MGDLGQVGGLLPGMAGTAPPVEEGALLAGIVEAIAAVEAAEPRGGYTRRPLLHEYFVGR